MSIDRRTLIDRLIKLGLFLPLAGRMSGGYSAAREGSELFAAFPPNREAIDAFCSQFTPGHITQYGYVVPGTASVDLDTQVFAWGKNQGVGPFCVLRPAPRTKVFKSSHRFAINAHGDQSDYRAVSNPSVEIALGQVDANAQIELILQRDLEADTVYRSVYPHAEQGGFHHACIVSKDLATDFQKLYDMGIAEGLQLDLLMTSIVGKVLYFDARSLPDLGCHFEITQETPFLKTISPVYEAIHHLGQVFGPFGQGATRSTELADLFIDREKLARTNILFEASSFAELGAKAIMLALKTGWIPSH